ncbi:hypothetical protein Tco_0946055 [Tanacetum coccineum]
MYSLGRKHQTPIHPPFESMLRFPINRVCLIKVTVAETGDEAVDGDEDEIMKRDYYYKLHEVALEDKGRTKNNSLVMSG